MLEWMKALYPALLIIKRLFAWNMEVIILTNHKTKTQRLIPKQTRFMNTNKSKLKVEMLLGGDIESARGLRRAAAEDYGSSRLNMHEFLAVVGVEEWLSSSITCSFSHEL